MPAYTHLVLPHDWFPPTIGSCDDCRLSGNGCTLLNLQHLPTMLPRCTCADTQPRGLGPLCQPCLGPGNLVNCSAVGASGWHSTLCLWEQLLSAHAPSLRVLTVSTPSLQTPREPRSLCTSKSALLPAWHRSQVSILLSAGPCHRLPEGSWEPLGQGGSVPLVSHT